MPRLVLLALLLGAAGPALAEPRVAVDIAPIHSIAAAVMAGVAKPELIVPPGVSEHHYALRPSEAAALAAADLVVWVGPGLTPWLEGPFAALAGKAKALTLTEAPGLTLLPVRAGGPFEPHDHHHDGPGGHAEPGDPHRHAAEDHAGTDRPDRATTPYRAGTNADHAHGEAAHSRTDDAVMGEPAQGPASTDPHIWLDPANGAAIAAAIASALCAVDPAHAATFEANAAAFAAEMAALEADIAAGLTPVADRPYMVFHDAYQYFEAAFAIPAAGSVALNDAEPPRARRVAEIRAQLTQERVDCVFAEPQFEPKLIATLIEDTGARTGTLDPLGADLEPGAGLYPALLRRLADDLAACLDPRSDGAE